MNKNLTIKQEKFVLKYFECGNASEAYRFAYSAKKMKPETIKRNAHNLLNSNNFTTTLINQRLSELREAQQKSFELSGA